jgi:hypothetical protein
MKHVSSEKPLEDPLQAFLVFSVVRDGKPYHEALTLLKSSQDYQVQ